LPMVFSLLLTVSEQLLSHSISSSFLCIIGRRELDSFTNLLALGGFFILVCELIEVAYAEIPDFVGLFCVYVRG